MDNRKEDADGQHTMPTSNPTVINKYGNLIHRNGEWYNNVELVK
jgi:hypothetical protein